MKTIIFCCKVHNCKHRCITNDLTDLYECPDGREVSSKDISMAELPSLPWEKLDVAKANNLKGEKWK